MKNLGRNFPIDSKEEAISYTETIQNAQGKEVKVLYQKLGTNWFAISMVEDNIYYGTLPDGIVGIA